MDSMIPTEELLNIQISVISPSGLIVAINDWVQSGKSILINNVNVHACNLACEQPAFRDVLNRSDIVFCDGFGVKLAGWMTGRRLGQRMTPPDWIDELFSMCMQKGYSVYFLGDESEVVQQFVGEVKRRFPELIIAGHHDGFFDPAGEENEQLLEDIAESEADIILTGMGMPRQEYWAWEAKSRLPKGVIIATGALFRWYTGYEKRAPQWMTNYGLEWLSRLLRCPRRHFKRYVIGLPLFYGRVIRWHWFRRKGNPDE
jgi:N-acetylglucosaminyldiphosphoundecaprenol N-acetyl-beta-D-mannosaminyltransferase